MRPILHSYILTLLQVLALSIIITGCPLCSNSNQKKFYKKNAHYNLKTSELRKKIQQHTKRQRKLKKEYKVLFNNSKKILAKRQSQEKNKKNIGFLSKIKKRFKKKFNMGTCSIKSDPTKQYDLVSVNHKRFKQINIRTKDNICLKGIYYENKFNPKKALIFIGGLKEDGNEVCLEEWQYLAYTICAENLGCSFLAMDYRGNGKSEGTLSIKGFQQDLQSQIDYLKKNKNINDIGLVAIGELASIIATQVASKQENKRYCKGVILIDPNDLKENRPIGLTYNLSQSENIEAIKDIHCPVAIFIQKDKKPYILNLIKGLNKCKVYLINGADNQKYHHYIHLFGKEIKITDKHWNPYSPNFSTRAN